MIFDTLSPAVYVLLILGLSLVAAPLARACGKWAGYVLAIAPLAGFVVLLLGIGPVMSGEPWRASWTWAPQLGMDWDVWVSPLGWLLAALVTGIGVLITLYGGGYLHGAPGRDRFFGCLFGFMGAMLGIALSENLVVMFVFWELTSVTSYLLIGYYHDKLEARKSALDALIVTAGGGVALIAGILLLGEIGGSYTVGELTAQRDVIVAHPLYPLAFFCVLLGAITKSAQVPFHFWLPGAMTAPAPVSAYLHSATMVKAGVFLLALLSPVMGGTDLWNVSLMIIGALTMTWAGVVAAMQTDLKRVLAFSTVSALGTLVMLLGMEGKLAAKATVVFLITHALYKAALFMVVGTVEKTTGIRDVTALRGLRRGMPAVAIAALIAALSMCGLPPLIGFIAKEVLYEVMLHAAPIGYLLLVCAVVANAANIVVALNVGVLPFIGNADNATPLKKKPTLLLWLGPLVLGVFSLAFGILPWLLGDTAGAVGSQVLGEPMKAELKIWHGFNLVLGLSALTVTAGVVGFACRRTLWRLGTWLNEDVGVSAQATFRKLLAGFLGLSEWLTRLIQSGDLKRYFIVMLFAVVSLIVGSIWTSNHTLELRPLTGWRLDAVIIVLVIAGAALSLTAARSRMTAVLLLGCVGFGISGLFALHGAPDLAITQLLVETLTLVLFSLAVFGLPAIKRTKDPIIERLVSLVLSVAFGGCFFLLTIEALDLQWQESVANEIARRCLPEAFGRNVVNVILVDFRALDTMGEISVLLIAALGVSAMLRGSKDRATIVESTRRSPVLAASARFTSPALLAFSVFLLLRGHNEPGGGFIGGLVGAMASVLVHLANPARQVTFLKLRPATLATIGLAIAVCSGLPGLITRGSFLAAEWGPSLYLPTLGKVKLGTPLLFDIGVYGVVAGIVMLLYRDMEAWHASQLQRKHVPSDALPSKPPVEGSEPVWKT